MSLPRALREVMTKRTIDDLTLKMQFKRKIPQKKLWVLFFEMCDLGIEQIIETEQKRFPEKSPSQIMREYYKMKDILSDRPKIQKSN